MNACARRRCTLRPIRFVPVSLRFLASTPTPGADGLCGSSAAFGEQQPSMVSALQRQVPRSPVEPSLRSAYARSADFCALQPSMGSALQRQVPRSPVAPSLRSAHARSAVFGEQQPSMGSALQTQMPRSPVAPSLRSAHARSATFGEQQPSMGSALQRKVQSSSGGSTMASSSIASLPAISTAWVRLVTPSLRRIAVTWALIVASETLRS